MRPVVTDPCQDTAKTLLSEAGQIAEEVEGNETREDVENVLDLLSRAMWEDMDTATRKTVRRWVSNLTNRLDNWDDEE